MITDIVVAHATHALFEYGGIALGVALYRRARQRSGLSALTASGSFALITGLLLGAAIGNKGVFAVERPDLIAAWWAGGPLVLGQSIVGGLLGGLLGIEAAKALTGQRASTGDLMVTPLIAGLVLGRVGCFLAGLHDDTYGLPTALPWGVDQGDGVPRHPSALYEIGFLVLLGTLLHRGQARWAAVPGLCFKLFLSAYLLWRLIGDSLKPVRVEYAGGLSGIQWVCLVALMAYAPLLARAWRRHPSALTA
ncbi:prolipoprotein diacylglyceryl transferase [Ideonella sp. 4Y11]|uniref:Prolipoprotein diacylglyceryl transferase n=1 Tax=Ideonella aquatica TaxID=2824119 RepID=A0A941BR80_9BURK|nr:prolipoprotein diacylglyceryl transferase family protein [Ideonella aquatica]MBQ0960045.1 prolipoprotein diacylglyceryl transferase [Ideonella aquatica]